VIRKVWR